MARKIELDKKLLPALREIVPSSLPAIRRALRGSEDTWLSARIRQVAKQLGGREIIYVKESKQ
jgi:hypothetical protein